MSKKVSRATESESLEIIELAIDDIELLARAFGVIAQVCTEQNKEINSLEPELPAKLLN